MGEIKTYGSEEGLDRAVQFNLYQHRGQANGIRRETLVYELFGVQVADVTDADSFDRNIRDAIERLRNQGHLICNLGDGSGYFIASSVGEYQAFRLRYGKHAFPILATIKQMDRAAAETWQDPLQPRLFEVDA
jgi:hypothetical protein